MQTISHQTLNISKTKEEFNKAVSKDFVAHANQTLISGKKFLLVRHMDNHQLVLIN